MDLTTRVCDVVPELGKPTARYTVTLPSGTERFDLCDDHAEPLKVFVEETIAARDATTAQNVKVSPRGATKKAAASGRGRRRVVTLEEIEKAKR